MPTKKSVYLFLFVMVGYLLVYIIPLGFRPLVMPDETRYAEISREMLSTHDFIVPKLAGFRYFEKPVLGYWINAFFIGFLGQNAFAVRIASALSAAFSALLILLMLRCGGAGELRRAAPAVFLTGAGVFLLGVHSCLDSMFALFVSGTLISFFAAYSEQGRRRSLFLLAAGAFCGAAFLTKGFVAFMFAGIVIVPFLMWERRWKDMLTMARIPIVAAVAVSLPWGIAVHLREPDFWHYFVVVEHLHRFASSDAQHAEPVWYYVPMLLEGLAPWIFLLSAAGAGLARGKLKEPVVRFASCWALLPLLFFTMSAGKLGTYLLPIFPAYTILLILGLQKYFDSGKTKLFTLGVILLGVTLAILFIAIVLIPVSGENDGCSFLCNLYILKSALLAAVSIWCALTFVAGIRSGLKPQRRLLLIAGGTAVFFSTLHFASSQLISNRKNPIDFLAARSRDISAETIIVADSYIAPAICWCCKRSSVFILHRGGELKYGIAADGGTKLLEFNAFNEMVESLAGRPLALVLNERMYKKYKPFLVSSLSVVSGDGFVFVRY
jgi:4-amino-4-deoxy-L-arabinose transferase